MKCVKYALNISGKSRVLNRTHLSFTDGDTRPDNIHISLASEPVHGGLYLRDSSESLTMGDSFPLTDLQNGLIKWDIAVIHKTQNLTSYFVTSSL